MIRRCATARLAEPEYSVSDGFRTTIPEAGLRDKSRVKSRGCLVTPLCAVTRLQALCAGKCRRDPHHGKEPLPLPGTINRTF